AGPDAVPGRDTVPARSAGASRVPEAAGAAVAPCSAAPGRGSASVPGPAVRRALLARRSASRATSAGRLSPRAGPGAAVLPTGCAAGCAAVARPGSRRSSSRPRGPPAPGVPVFEAGAGALESAASAARWAGTAGSGEGRSTAPAYAAPARSPGAPGGAGGRGATGGGRRLRRAGSWRPPQGDQIGQLTVGQFGQRGLPGAEDRVGEGALGLQHLGDAVLHRALRDQAVHLDGLGLA